DTPVTPASALHLVGVLDAPEPLEEEQQGRAEPFTVKHLVEQFGPERKHNVGDRLIDGRRDFIHPLGHNESKSGVGVTSAEAEAVSVRDDVRLVGDAEHGLKPNALFANVAGRLLLARLADSAQRADVGPFEASLVVLHKEAI